MVMQQPHMLQPVPLQHGSQPVQQFPPQGDKRTIIHDLLAEHLSLPTGYYRHTIPTTHDQYPMTGALLTIDAHWLELLIAAGLFLAAVLPFLRQAKRQKVAGLVALTLALTAGLGYFKYTMDSRNDASRAALLAPTPAQARLKPVTAPNNAYTSSQTCRACHPSEYKSWPNS